ncbi:MAG TPA: hypothetical protein VK745_21735 [Polyangiaceae bacterium]|nr:hypothetical protein [Polyangiaceae bacterium]
MLNNLDVVISFATIMLGVSMLVMVGTQTISAVLNLRGTQLRAGLREMFIQGSNFTPEESAKVADEVLLHPLLSDGVVGKRLAPAIQKSELTRVLKLLKAKGAFDKIEKIEEKLSATEAFVEDWFSAAMDRVAHRFAGMMRGATIVLSFGLAFALHLDTLDLLSQLSSSAALRESLLVSAKAIQERATTTLSTPPTPGTDANSSTFATFTGLIGQAKGIQTELGSAQFQLIPSPYPGLNFDKHIWGIIASAVLLSLGAPFWFNLLSSASSLRPVLAQKVDAAESNQPSAAA